MPGTQRGFITGFIVHRGVKEKQTHACRFCRLQPTPPPPPPPAREPAGVQGSSCRRCLGSSSRFRAPQKERCVRPVAVAALGGGGTRCTLENERPLVLCAPPMSSAVLYQSQGCSTPGFHPQDQIIVLFFVDEAVRTLRFGHQPVDVFKRQRSAYLYVNIMYITC